MESLASIHQKPTSDKGIDIVFRNISYSVDVPVKSEGFSLPCMGKTAKKELLKNVSGIFKAGEITAIMGASGAGKTTLLNVLACRVSLYKQEGQILANNQYYDYQNFGDFANYVMQNDIFMQTLTVRQTLKFAADLKLNVSQQEKLKTLKQLAKSLKLQNCLDTLVGGMLIKGISGGQRKRTSIAFELISDPQVIMLDEPTSGLDSLTSFVIVKYLSELAREKKKTIVMTIHQPNAEIFALFQRLILMVNGKLIFQGPANSAPEYFAREFGLTFPEFYNPADFFMTIMHNQTPGNVERYQSYFSAYDKNFSLAIEQQIQNRKTHQFQKREINVSWMTSFCTLISRDVKNIIRNPMMIKSRLFQTIVLSIYVGGLYCKFGQDYTETITWHAVTGFFFFLTINSIMTALSPVTLIFPQERNVFLKQEGSKLYGVNAYFLSRNTVEIPYAFIFPALQSLILYWFVGLSSTAGQFFTFYLTILLINFCGMSMGLLIGSSILDARAVGAVTPLIVMPLQLFSGFFKNENNLPKWIGWVQYISPFKYGFSAFTQNEVLHKASNAYLLNFDVGLWGSIGCLLGVGLAFRVLSWFLLWKLRTKLE